MSNLDKYKSIFVETLEIPAETVEGLSMNNCDKWDSIGQMGLIAMIEEEFGFEFSPEETMSFVSYQSGLAVLKNHNIEL